MFKDCCSWFLETLLQVLIGGDLVAIFIDWRAKSLRVLLMRKIRISKSIIILDGSLTWAYAFAGCLWASNEFPALFVGIGCRCDEPANLILWSLTELLYQSWMRFRVGSDYVAGAYWPGRICQSLQSLLLRVIWSEKWLSWLSVIRDSTRSIVDVSVELD